LWSFLNRKRKKEKKFITVVVFADQVVVFDFHRNLSFYTSEVYEKKVLNFFKKISIYQETYL